MTEPTVVFLAGLGRSGSTVLEQALAELGGVHALGEVVHLWRRGLLLDERCGCGEAFHACPFWSQVGAVGFGGWNGLDVDRVESLRESVDRTRYIPLMRARRLRPSYTARLDEYVGYYRRVYAAAQQVTGCDVLVDSSKHPSLAYALAASGVRLRVVQVVRDPRAVAYSWTKAVTRPEATTAADRLMTVYPPTRSALLWDSHNVALRALRRSETPTLCVRHEDFVTDPAGVLREVAAFAGLGDDVALPLAGKRDLRVTPQHTVSGNPARFRTGAITIRGSDEWRRRLTRRDRIAVTALTLPLLRHYGYVGSAGSRIADDGTAQ